jgi:hypothetical protein
MELAGVDAENQYVDILFSLRWINNYKLRRGSYAFAIIRKLFGLVPIFFSN